MAIIPPIATITIKNKIISKPLWYFKQLFPLLYYAEYTIHIKKKDIKCVTVWKMWLGKSYNIRSWEVLKEVEHMTNKEKING